MNDKIKAVFASPAVRKAVLSLVLAVLAALGVSYGTGCTQLTPAQQARVDLFECRVKALEPVVGSVFDASDLVREMYAGHVNLGSVLGTLKVTQAEADAIVESFNACDPQLPAGQPS
jgi:hypothetical protein